MALNSSFRENGSIVVTSGDRLTIENAAEFARLLREALEAEEDIVMKFEADVEIDFTAIQILYSGCRTAASNGKSFSYSGMQPKGLTDMIAACGAEPQSLQTLITNQPVSWFGGEK